MKCPHCGMIIRDNVVVCGYCGGKITQRPEISTGPGGKPNVSGSGIVQRGAKTTRPLADEPEGEGEEGGLSAYLQPGEQVIIGSLNVSVKKFLFHAYLTDKRIFLIDTQEKKLKVTAKDIPLDSIAGSIIEFSENSDPVLVLSIKSVDDEIKTMKLVFVQNGMDRSSEIDEWIALLQEQKEPRKSQRAAAEEVRDQKEEPEPVPKVKSAPKQDLSPARKPLKDHEKQPPVKRLLSFYQVPAPETEEPGVPPSRDEAPDVEGAAVRKPPVQPSAQYGGPLQKKPTVHPVRKPEVQSAMKVAMKSAMQPLRQPTAQPVKKAVIQPTRKVVPEPEMPEDVDRKERFTIQELPIHDEQVEIPQFCHNCGKRLPQAANFCPGCGTKLVHHKPSHSTHASSHEKKSPKPKVIDREENDDEAPKRPPKKKAPQGSEMTILHKFLRR